MINIRDAAYGAMKWVGLGNPTEGGVQANIASPGLARRLITFGWGAVGSIVEKMIGFIPFGFPPLSRSMGKLIQDRESSHTYSLRKNQSIKTGIIERVGSFFNSHTILRGASQSWDSSRIREGKLVQYKKIGAQEVEIHTKSGDVHACYFGVDEFVSKIKEMGGEFISIRIKHNLPILRLAIPAKLTIGENDFKYDAVIISYDKNSADLFKDLSKLRSFCKKQRCAILYKDGTPISETSSKFLPLSSASKSLDLMIVAQPILQDILSSKHIIVESIDEFAPMMSIFSPKSFETKGIVFYDNQEDVKELFEDLKLRRSSQSFVEVDKASYIVSQTDELMMQLVAELDSFQYEIQKMPLQNKNVMERGVILMTMNQNNSYFQYSHEILTFLFEGVNVFAYDNFGKGMSRGVNSEQGLLNAIEGSYYYLTEIKRFSDEQILAKGQCAGGPPTSELGKRHPNIHLWIDQAPASYNKMVRILYKEYIKQGIEKLGKSPTITNRILSILANSIADSTKVPQLIENILPLFDIPHNLQQNRGAQLFTIGVPNEVNQGGDQLIPKEQQKEIVEALRKSPRGFYIPLFGAEHVTDWWLIPDAAHSVRAFMNQHEIAKDPLI